MPPYSRTLHSQAIRSSKPLLLHHPHQEPPPQLLIPSDHMEAWSHLNQKVLGRTKMLRPTTTTLLNTKRTRLRLRQPRKQPTTLSETPTSPHKARIRHRPRRRRILKMLQIRVTHPSNLSTFLPYSLCPGIVY